MGANDRQHRLAYGYALVAVFFWATSASAFKLSLNHISGLSLLLYASATSAVVFFIFVTVTGKLRQLRTFTKRDYLWSAGLGLLNPFLYYVILFKAYSLLLAQEAQPINFVWPLTLVLLSIPLLHQRIKPRSILAIVISFVGVVVIALRIQTPADLRDFRFTSAPGAALALSTTVVWSLYWIYNTRDRRDETVRLFLNFVFALAYIVVLLLVTGKFETPNWPGLAGGVYVGLFEMGITFLAWLRALKLAKTTAHVVNLIYLVPFLSLVIIALVLGETILVSTVVGLVLIITGIVLQKAWA
ncbi:MAG: DMT family transporter [Sedimentisphaerales bacterium]|nr:DMT family transporter [Sedimentisphaerales bacterium]